MTIKDILKICNGKLLSGSGDVVINKFSKDSRSIQKNELYVGIKGEKFDGNNYIKDAFDKGACAAIIDNKNINISLCKNETIVLVNDSIEALCELAKYKRNHFKGKVVGITGSVGKTTTKDLISEVLKTKYKVLSTKGSFNNNIGLPLSILNGEESDVWVIEMGMNNLGEISYLSKIVRPHISVITNIGTSHIGLLGSRENILKAKLEILDGMESGKLIINNDNDLLHDYYINNKDNIITVGINNESDYQIKVLSNMISINNKQYKLFSYEEPLVIDSVLAYAVGKELKCNDELLSDVFIKFNQQGNRLNEEISESGFLIIDDSFNASYDSMKLAIDFLSKKKRRKIIVLGDMLELGDYSKELHEEVGKLVASSNINILLTVGEYSNFIHTTAIDNDFNGECRHFKDNDKCYKYIESIINSKDIILFKASKKMDFTSLCKRVKEL